MSDFRKFAQLVHARFNTLSKLELFVTGVDNNVIWEKYLSAFPAGTDPIYKERTEHDCSCCKQFIRKIGNVVAIIDGKPQSIWDLQDLDHPYQTVADALNDWVINSPITGIFRPTETTYGVESNKQLLETYLELFPDVQKKEVTDKVMAIVASNFENNTIGIRLLNTLVHQYFIEGGLTEKQTKKTTFQKTLSLN